jgi:integrase/recombinase XerD
MENSIVSTYHIIVPLEKLQVSAILSGSEGSNRSTTDRPLIAADNDLDAVKAWLARYVDSKATFESYRKEAERLLLWSFAELGKPLSSLTHEDLLVYQRFICDPQPVTRWVMAGRKVSRQDDAWRPFAGPLSPTSQRQCIIILNGMFSWLVNAGYLAGNPLSLSRQRQRKAQSRITRFLETDLWNEVKTTIEAMPRETNRQREHYFRVRWLFSLLYITGMRISEVVQNTMGRIFTRLNANQDELWWIEITGKGNKTRMIPMTDELLGELERYRREMGLSLKPFEGEATPLLIPIGGKQRPLTRAAVHLILKKVFMDTAKRLEMRGPESASKAARLMAASAHWLRHTAGSNMASNMDIHYVRDNMGHGSIATTNNYIHTEEDKRHVITQLNHKLAW